MRETITNEKGDVLKIFIEGLGFVPKEAAHKILYKSVDKVDVEMYLRTIAKPYSVPFSVVDLITDILNEKETLYGYKAKIMKIDTNK